MVKSLHLFVAAVTLSPLALAASLSPRQAPPTCVVNCIGTSTAVTSCATSDFQCLCVSSAFIDAVASCLNRDCSADEYDVGVALGTQYCASVGVTVSIPPRADAGDEQNSTPTDASGSSSAESMQNPEPETTSPSTTTTTTSSSPSSSSSSSPDAPAIAPSSAVTNPPTSDTPHSLSVSSTAILAGAGVAMAILA